MRGIKILFSILALSVSVALAAQNITVKGTVTDASNGDPVPATSVIVSGTTQGVVSDVDGVYSISVPSDGVLIFCQWGCKQTQGLAMAAKKVFEANGLPALVLDGDGCDRANGGGEQIVTRANAFVEELEGLREMKKS